MRLVDIPENPLPPGAVVHEVSVGTVRLRVARWPAPAGRPPAGTVVVLPGRSEFIEKYAEVVGDLLARGLAVVVIDWRGQGGSSRLLDNIRKGHVRHFAEYRADLDAVAATVLAPHCPRPWIGLGHSMGGAIALDHAARGTALFDSLVLSAPMIDLYKLRLAPLARLLAAVVTLCGFGARYVPGGSDAAWMARPFAGNGLTSDARRFAIFNALARAAPELVLGAPTFGWLHAAFRVMRAVTRPRLAKGLRIPTLVVACGDDRVVDTAATLRLAALLAEGCCVVVPGSLHEVLMEDDAHRGQFWAAFDTFVDGGVAAVGRPGEPTAPELVGRRTGP